VDIVRVTVNNKDASEAIADIVRMVDVPIVADIHFNYTFALKALKQVFAKVRINPGNIGKVERVQKVLMAAKNAAFQSESALIPVHLTRKFWINTDILPLKLYTNQL